MVFKISVYLACIGGVIVFCIKSLQLWGVLSIEDFFLRVASWTIGSFFAIIFIGKIADVFINLSTKETKGSIIDHRLEATLPSPGSQETKQKEG